MITFWVSDLYTWIRTAASRIKQLLGVQNFFQMTKLEFPSQKIYNLTYIITFWVSDLYTWIRTAASRIQQLPGVQKFIFNDKIGIPIPKNITFDIHNHFLGKWPLYLDKEGFQKDPGAARCTEIYFWCQIWNSHPKTHKFDIHDQFLDKWPLYLDQVGSQQDPGAARCQNLWFYIVNVIINLKYPIILWI